MPVTELGSDRRIMGLPSLCQPTSGQGAEAAFFDRWSHAGRQADTLVLGTIGRPRGGQAVTCEWATPDRPRNEVAGVGG